MRRDLAPSRSIAVELIELGRCLVNGAVADKASRQVDPGDAIVIQGPAQRFVSRGGEKLAAALEAFALDVHGLFALDAGASTGGFTDCLLQAGAARIAAVDVGHGQLHPKIRNDARVLVRERLNIRALTARDIDGPVDLVVADLSFISLDRVIAALIAIATPGAPMILLVKPQFEAGRSEVAKAKGVIKDPEIHERIRAEVEQMLLDHGCQAIAWIDSPIMGAEGNREFLVHARTPVEATAP